MITIDDYFGPRKNHPEATQAMRDAADELLGRVNRLLDLAAAAEAYDHAVSPNTGTQVSGSKGGSGDGGWRPHDAKTGAPRSKHKLARAVDVYDPGNKLDTWLSDRERPGGGNSVLEQHGLYREDTDATPGWCHLQDMAPGSGRRTFPP